MPEVIKDQFNLESLEQGFKIEATLDFQGAGSILIFSLKNSQLEIHQRKGQKFNQFYLANANKFILKVGQVLYCEERKIHSVDRYPQNWARKKMLGRVLLITRKAIGE